eukprot:TRINITY_DN2291_c0_g1_i1.p1 TRINITY_DN2291_c0_g1~~TRINITY_DN2291_c0_g1_i1.p1  ORF type:complete len:69 (+),score=20.93 TRINITY_DN2291_c0_g1_i1:204-410(+)
MVEEGEEKKSDGVTEEDVRGFLSRFGEVTKCKVRQKPAGTFCYVDFKEVDAATQAKDSEEGEIKGSKF